MQQTAARFLVEGLRRHAVDRVFCVPGESYLPVLDALYDETSIQVITCRHEGGAGFMAVADAKMTGRVGVAMVSRGPGAANATIAVHTAEQDAVPLLLLVGQVSRQERGRGAFQEVDYGKTFADMAKGVREIHDPEEIGEALSWACHLAQMPTPGAVVLALPEDMLREKTQSPASAPLEIPPLPPRSDDIHAVVERLAEAKRPLMIIGGGLQAAQARRELLAASEALALPVVLSFKNQDIFPNDHPNFAAYLGYGSPPQVIEALSEADLVLAVGTRLGDVTTQGFRFPRPQQPLIHVYPDAAKISRNFQVSLSVVAEPDPFSACPKRKCPAALEDMNSRRAWCEGLHAGFRSLADYDLRDPADGVDFGRVIQALGKQLSDDAVVAMDAGNFGGWLHRHHCFNPRQKLIGVISGAMGMGVPGAVAAALRYPDRDVVSVIGDGGFLMTGQELATAVHYGARPRLFVANNASYATIRLHQEKAYPGRPVATDLTNPDFARLAEAYGATGFTIEDAASVEDIVAAALAVAGPVVVDVKTSLERISAYTTLTDLAKG